MIYKSKQRVPPLCYTYRVQTRNFHEPDAKYGVIFFKNMLLCIKNSYYTLKISKRFHFFLTSLDNPTRDFE